MSVYLDGSSYLSLNSVPVTAYPYSIMVRYKPDDLVTAVQTMWGVANAGSNGDYHVLEFRPASPSIRSERTPNFSAATSAHATLNDAEWIAGIMVCASSNDCKTYAGTLGIVATDYVARLEQTTADSTANALSGAFTRMVIGAFPGAALGSNFKGWIAEVCVVNIALTDAQRFDYLGGMDPRNIVGISGANVIFFGSLESSLTPEVKTGTLTNSGGVLDTDEHPVIIRFSPALYSTVPRVFIDPDELEDAIDLFVTNHDEANRIAVFGDSTSTEQGAGFSQMAHRRFFWHQILGNTPGTQLIASGAQTGIGGPDYQFWLACCVPHLGVTTDPAYTLDQLLPGYNFTDGSIRKFRNDSSSGNGGTHVLLNHNCDSDGFTQVSDSLNGGNPAYLRTNMDGPGSYMNLFEKGLTLEVLALTAPGSADEVFIDKIEATDTNPIDTSATPTGTTASIGLGLDAAVGTVKQYDATFGHNAPGTPNCWFQGRVTSNDATDYVWLLGTRWVSADQRGLIFDSISRSGYRSYDFDKQHPNSLFIIDHLDYDAVWMRYGHNDGTNGDSCLHPAAFNQFVRRLIATLRGRPGKSEMPVILAAVPHQLAASSGSSGSYTVALQYYADILYHIAQDLDNVWLVNTMRITEEDDGWDATDGPDSYTSDGIHYNKAGSIAVATAEVNIFATEGELVPESGGGISGARGLVSLLIPMINRRKRLRRR